MRDLSQASYPSLASTFYHTVVGDNAKRLEQAIEVAESRADLIIFREDWVQQKMI